MPGIALVRHVSSPLQATPSLRDDAAGAEPEQVEEVFDAELVGESPTPGWLAVPAILSYSRAGCAQPSPRIDLRA